MLGKNTNTKSGANSWFLSKLQGLSQRKLPPISCPQTKFLYESIVNFQNFIKEIERDTGVKYGGKDALKKADKNIKTLNADIKNNSEQSIKSLDDRTASQLLIILDDIWKTSKTCVKIAALNRQPIELPNNLQLVYAVLEIKNIGQRVHNRIDSSYLYDDSKEKEVLKSMIDTDIDRMFSDYIMNINACSDPKELSIYRNAFVTKIEYMLILFNKIEHWYSLHTFKHMPSNTTTALEQAFNEYYKTQESLRATATT